jgi:hypothetical protein
LEQLDSFQNKIVINMQRLQDPGESSCE